MGLLNGAMNGLRFHLQRRDGGRPAFQPYGGAFSSYDEAVGYVALCNPWHDITVEPHPGGTMTITNPHTNETREYLTWHLNVYEGRGYHAPHEAPTLRYYIIAE